jgi:hypothetical protein
MGSEISRGLSGDEQTFQELPRLSLSYQSRDQDVCVQNDSQ